MLKKLVSIIIVTYNNDNVIAACLNALYEQDYRNFEIIVVDNCSHDASLDIIREYLAVQLINSKTNVGFTGGNILGLQHAQGEFIVLLNPDTEVSPAWLAELVEGMSSNSKIGLCASNLLVYASDRIDSAGDGCTTTGRGFKRYEGEISCTNSQNEYVFGACGGAVMIRKELIDEIGFLDEDFFLIYEDTDYSFRAQLAGWKCLFIPKAIVYHKVRSSIGHMSDLAVYYSIRNARLVWVKNIPISLLIKYFYQHILQEIGLVIFFCIKHKKWALYWQANIDFIRLLPKMIQKRRKINMIKKITNSEIDAMLTSVLEYKIFMVKLRKIFF